MRTRDSVTFRPSRFARAFRMLAALAVVAGIGILNPIPASAVEGDGLPASTVASGTSPAPTNRPWRAYSLAGITKGTVLGGSTSFDRHNFTNTGMAQNTGSQDTYCLNGSSDAILARINSESHSAGSAQVFVYSSDVLTGTGATQCPATHRAAVMVKYGPRPAQVNGVNQPISSPRIIIVSAYANGGSLVALPAVAGPIGTGNTCRLNDASLVRIARGAGFPETNLQIAVAVALAESGGLVSASNFNGPNPGSWDIGLWQINDGAHPSYNRDLLFTSPGYNAQTALTISNGGTNWTPWVAFTTGAHNKYMSRAASAIAQAPGTLGGNSCSDLNGGDLVPDEDDGSKDEDGNDNGCGFTLNPFTATKCALKWAFVPEEGSSTKWSESVDEMAAQPPVSTVTETMSFVTSFLGAYGDSCQGNGCTCRFSDEEITADPTIVDACSPSIVISNDVNIEPIVAAGDMMSSPIGSAFRYALGAMITFIAVMRWYNMLTTSLGSKDTA